MIKTVFDNSEVTANSKQLDVLKKHFPQCFDKHGAFMPEKLQDLVSASGSELSKESYNLNWLGKSYARLLANENPRTLLSEDKEHNAKPENKASENLLIKGDNLEVLKHLVNAYSEQVKMIYIDPPYNTGSDGFVYQDDRKFTAGQLSQLAGIDKDEAQRILDFTQSKANSHSAWLTFMYPRLYVARELLKDDGVIFISIDDNEVAQLKILCDEVFGEQNFIATLTWEKKRKGSFLSKKTVSIVEWVHVYGKTVKNRLFGGLANTNESQPLVKRTNAVTRLSFSRGLVKTKLSDGIYKTGKYGSGSSSVDLLNDIKVLNGVIETDFTLEGPFVWSQAYLEKQMSSGTTLVLNTLSFQVRAFKTQESSKGLPTLINGKSFSATNEDGYEELRDLLEQENIMDYPKPVSLMKYLVNAASYWDKDSLVIDFFAGSGTTAHAVMQLNAEDGGNRRCISVQIDEATDKKSEAYKAGYKTIFDITKARIEKAAAKIKEENPDYEGDLGFKIFETKPLPEEYLQDIPTLSSEQQALPLMTSEVDDMLTTWKVYDGIALTKDLQEVDLKGYTAYQQGKVCYLMHKGFSSEALVAFLQKLDDTENTFEVEKLVVNGVNFDSKHQREIHEAITQYKNKKDKHISVEFRY